MLHTKLCVKRPAGSGEEDIEGFLPYMDVAAILVFLTSIMPSDFHFLVPESFLTKFGSELHSSF